MPSPGFKAKPTPSIPSKLKTYMRPPNHRYLFMSLSVLAALFFSSERGVAQTNNAAAPKSQNILYAELDKVPAKASARHNPMEHDRDAIEAGGKLYGLHCAECHGATGEGGNGAKKGPSLRALEIQQATPGTLFWLLTNGVVRRGMPVWSKLPEPQRWQIVSYIKSLSGPPGTKAEPDKTQAIGAPGGN